MSSLRVRLLLTLLAMLGFAAIVIGAVTYRNVLGETEALFDYQLRQMALSLRDQGEITRAQASTLGRPAARFRRADLDRRRPQHLCLAAAQRVAGARAARLRRP